MCNVCKITIYVIQTVARELSLFLSHFLSLSFTLICFLSLSTNCQQHKKLHKVWDFCLLLAIFKWYCHSAQKSTTHFSTRRFVCFSLLMAKQTAKDTTQDDICCHESYANLATAHDNNNRYNNNNNSNSAVAYRNTVKPQKTTTPDLFLSRFWHWTTIRYVAF